MHLVSWDFRSSQYKKIAIGGPAEFVAFRKCTLNLCRSFINTENFLHQTSYYNWNTCLDGKWCSTIFQNVWAKFCRYLLQFSQFGIGLKCDILPRIILEKYFELPIFWHILLQMQSSQAFKSCKNHPSILLLEPKSLIYYF